MDGGMAEWDCEWEMELFRVVREADCNRKEGDESDSTKYYFCLRNVYCSSTFELSLFNFGE